MSPMGMSPMGVSPHEKCSPERDPRDGDGYGGGKDLRLLPSRQGDAGGGGCRASVQAGGVGGGGGGGGSAGELREGYTIAELAKDARLPVLVVAENRLGVLNHLRLTVHYLRSEGLSLVGVVVNDRTAEAFPAREPNEGEGRRGAGGRCLGRGPPGR